MTDASYNFKLQIVSQCLTKNHADALLLISSPNRSWMTELGPIIEDGLVLVTKKSTYLLVDHRDITFCQKYANKHIQPVIWENITSIQQLVKKLKIKHLLVERDYATLEQIDNFVKPLGVKFTPINTMILRAAKSDDEIKFLKQSAAIAIKAINDVRQWIHPGVSELETKQHIHQFMGSCGATADSFDLIIAFGKNTANPHHQAGNTILKNNQLVTCDIGCIYRGYCSDITRTFFVGDKPTKDERKLFDLVKQAQALGLRSAKVGIKGNQLDGIVRSFIAKDQRWGKMFKHGLGHGVGIEIHECPSCRPTYSDPIINRSCITIEPGIYEDGFAGVRIEDTIIVENSKIVNITGKANKNFFK